jgi:hypothetical protein
VRGNTAWAEEVSARRLFMINSAQKRGKLIKHLEDALALADENRGWTDWLSDERALEGLAAAFDRLKEIGEI